MKGMNGITDAHIFVWRAYVHIGYSIHTLHETTKINFQFLNKMGPLIFHASSIYMKF